MLLAADLNVSEIRIAQYATRIERGIVSDSGGPIVSITGRPS